MSLVDALSSLFSRNNRLTTFASTLANAVKSLCFCVTFFFRNEVDTAHSNFRRCDCDNCWPFKVTSDLARMTVELAAVKLSVVFVLPQKVWLFANMVRDVRISSTPLMRGIFDWLPNRPSSSLRRLPMTGWLKLHDAWTSRSSVDGENNIRLDLSTRRATSTGIVGFGFCCGGLWNRARFASRVGAIDFVDSAARLRAEPGVLRPDERNENAFSVIVIGWRGSSELIYLEFVS